MVLTYKLYKRTRKGFIKIRIQLIRDSNPTKIKITIENSGQGIEKSELNVLFQKNIQSEKEKVVGFGLKITNSLVKRLGNSQIKVHPSNQTNLSQTSFILID